MRQDLKAKESTRNIWIAIADFSGRQGTSQALVIRNGYMIWKGNGIDNWRWAWSCTKQFDNQPRIWSWSCTKLFNAGIVMGLLVEDGLCTPDDFAKDYLPDLSGQYDQVRLRHFATMTSGYDAGGDQASD